MNQFEQSYSDNWKNLGTILTFQNKNFQFKSSIIITELDQCLVKPLSQAKLYNTMNPYELEIYEEEFIKKLQVASTDHSIVILSNQINTNKLNIDMIKKKVEMIADVLDIPLIGFFALRPNCFMKPHTGMWKLVNAYYKKYGSACIQKAVVISNQGGMIWEKETKKGTIRTVAFRDTDRAFATNAGIPFKSIDEYLDDCKPLDYAWDTRIIPPETRDLYVEQIRKRENANIFKTLGHFKACDTYVIMIMGAPRSGKTRLSNHIIKKWRSSPFGDMNAVERLGMDDYTNKRRFKKFTSLIQTRISVVLDGNCHSDSLRRPFLQFLKDRNVPILVIEVNCGLQMAKVFNHVHVEESNDMNVTLYKKRDYDIYKSYRKAPATNDRLRYTLHTPAIEQRNTVMNFRY